MDGITALQRLDGGRHIDRWYAALEAVAAEVWKTKSKGSVAVTFDVEWLNDDLTVSVTTRIKPNPPAQKGGGALFYTFEGGLYRDDPRQIAMEFRVVEDDGKAEIRTAADSGAVREAGE